MGEGGSGLFRFSTETLSSFFLRKAKIESGGAIGGSIGRTHTERERERDTEEEPHAAVGRSGRLSVC